jgi:hypothetical protein
VPDSYFDLLLPQLGLAEWRVLLYVVRRTLGFKKLSDAISLDQFTSGVTTREGARLDAGTGLSRSNVHEALNQLVMRNVLVRQRVHDPQTGDGVSIFSLTMRDDVRHSMGASLGLAPGPLREAAAGGAVREGVLQDDQEGDLPLPYQGDLQLPYPPVPPVPYPGVPTMPYVREPNRPEKRQGGPHRNHPRGLQMPYQGPLQEHHPESRRVPATGSAAPLPPGTSRTPQEIDLQETVKQPEGLSAPSPYAALVAQIAADLGTHGGTTAYTARIDALAATAPVHGPAFFELLLTAWKITAGRLHNGLIDQPGAAMQYWLSVVQDLLSKEARRPAAAPAPSHPAGSDLQDHQFLALARERAGALPSQEPWLRILRGLAETMVKSNYTRWFVRSALYRVDDALVVIVDNALQQQWLATRMHDVVQREALNQGISLPVQFITLGDLR